MAGNNSSAMDGADTTDLERSDLRRLQRREWAIERIGRYAIAATLVTGLLGLLGPGLLSNRVRESAERDVSVKFARIIRHEAPTEMTIRLSQRSAARDVRLAISRTFTDRTTPENIVPRPVMTEGREDVVVYTFRMEGASDSGQVVYRYSANRVGNLDFTIALDGRPGVAVSQFVAP